MERLRQCRCKYIWIELFLPPEGHHAMRNSCTDLITSSPPNRSSTHSVAQIQITRVSSPRRKYIIKIPSMLGFAFNSGHAATAPSTAWSTPNPTSRLLSDFRSGLKSPLPLQRDPLDPAKDIHRMLENYSTDISRTGLHTARCALLLDSWIKFITTTSLPAQARAPFSV